MLLPHRILPTMVTTSLRRLVTFPRSMQVLDKAGLFFGVLSKEVPLLQEDPPLWPILTRIVARVVSFWRSIVSE
jgi:hypothetical protein